jgi:16S rRNA (cytidine1402-2'-O)-methyltransferase
MTRSRPGGGTRSHAAETTAGTETTAAASAAAGGEVTAHPRAREGTAAATDRGTLFVVATPIGNLADVTQRALDVLGSVPLVAAEDTRVARRLLDRNGIRARLVSYHARSGPGRLDELLDHLSAGQDLALVTDAGTPLVSDPGDELVATWALGGGRVVPIPGASAVMAAVSATGIAGPHWTFEGFLPRRGRERRDRIDRIAGDPRGSVIFEAANRLAATLADLAARCGPDRLAGVARELTKLHEQVEVAPLGDLAARAASGAIPARGEAVIVIGRSAGAGSTGSAPPVSLEAARAEVERLVAGGASRSAAARQVAAATGVSRRQLYGSPQAWSDRPARADRRGG